MKLTLTHKVHDSLELHYQGQTLFRYVYEPNDAPMESPRPYFHPLRTLRGNEVTLFRHFGNKLNLVAAIIERFSPVNGLKTLIDEDLTGDYHEDLRQISKYIIAGMTEQPDIMPLVLFEAHQIPELRELLESVPRQMFSVLIQYFERQTEAGNVRADLSPFLIAQSFFFLNASFARTMRYVQERKYPLPLSTDAAPEQLLEIFLHGVSTKK